MHLYMLFQTVWPYRKGHLIYIYTFDCHQLLSVDVRKCHSHNVNDLRVIQHRNYHITLYINKCTNTENTHEYFYKHITVYVLVFFLDNPVVYIIYFYCSIDR